VENGSKDGGRGSGGRRRRRGGRRNRSVIRPRHPGARGSSLGRASEPLGRSRDPRGGVRGPRAESPSGPADPPRPPAPRPRAPARRPRHQGEHPSLAAVRGGSTDASGGLGRPPRTRLPIAPGMSPTAPRADPDETRRAGRDRWRTPDNAGLLSTARPWGAPLLPTPAREFASTSDSYVGAFEFGSRVVTAPSSSAGIRSQERMCWKRSAAGGVPGRLRRWANPHRVAV